MEFEKLQKIISEVLNVDEDENGSNNNSQIINSIPMIFATDTTIKLGEEFNPLSGV